MHDLSLPGKNRHPVDQLGDIRQTIKTLQEREAELKDIVSAQMGQSDALGGDEWIASQSLQSRKGGLDEAKLSKALGNLDPYRKPSSTFVVMKVERRVAGAA